MRNLCEVCKIECGDDPASQYRDSYNEIRIVCPDCRSGKKHKYNIFGYDILEKTPKASGNGAVAYIPKEWIGSRLAIIRLDQK